MATEVTSQHLNSTQWQSFHILQTHWWTDSNNKKSNQRHFSNGRKMYICHKIKSPSFFRMNSKTELIQFNAKQSKQFVQTVANKVPRKWQRRTTFKLSRHTFRRTPMLMHMYRIYDNSTNFTLRWIYKPGVELHFVISHKLCCSLAGCCGKAVAAKNQYSSTLRAKDEYIFHGSEFKISRLW